MSLIDLADFFGFPQTMCESTQSQNTWSNADAMLKQLYGEDYVNKFSSSIQTIRSGMKAATKLDMYKSADGVELKADIAGYSKEELNISVEQNILTISGERKVEASEETEFYYRERTQTTFSRKVTLPFNADPKTIKAQYENGVLTVYVPQPEISKLTPIKIE